VVLGFYVIIATIHMDIMDIVHIKLNDAKLQERKRTILLNKKE